MSEGSRPAQRLDAARYPTALSDAGGSTEDAVAEMRVLVTDLRDAARDGRMLVRRYADLLRATVDEYCTEFEKRAEAALKKLEDAS
jgi:hypothetical protein